MMRYFVAFSLLLFVLEISVEASSSVPEVFLFCFAHAPRTCKAHCLESNCRNGQCKGVPSGQGREVKCICEDCPGGQQRKKQLH
ncbi:unnamed protein product [Cylicocyclus nassatus]|uniref:Uncharacterized protein n=1 Tax=Cylicocyclus nassatus TaxID=53992 RepID=A0AA36HCL7_CYLNA|nr:unnamed protein product [Cylicocyclus nassatus]